MARNAKEISTGSGEGSKLQAKVLAPGAYPARVVQIVYMGVQEQRPYKGEAKKPVDEIRITYELSSEFMQDEEGKDLTDKPRWFSEDIPFYSLKADRAKSTKRYTAIDPADTCDGDFALLAGKACQVVIINNPGKGKHLGKTFCNIADITPAPNLPGYEQPALVNNSFTFDPQDDSCTLEAFNTIPEFVRTKMVGALDFKGSALDAILNGGGNSNGEGSQTSTPEEPSTTQSTEAGDDMYG